MPLLLVIAGGGAGAGLRYLVGIGTLRLLGPRLPWGTFAVNLSGGLAMGVVVGMLARHPGDGHAMLRLALGVGMLGGYTTFSSFSLETVNMIERGEPLLALGYVVASAAGAVLLVWAGLAAVRALPA